MRSSRPIPRIATRRALFALALLAGSLPSAAQTDPTAALASRSAIIVLGTVTRAAASEEPLLAPSDSTAVVKVDRMYAGSEIAGDQTGRSVTVILSKPGSVKLGSQAIFFGNPRFLGKAITIADEGELPVAPAEADRLAPTLERGLQARRDAPLRARLATAEKIFRGTVETVRPLAGEAKGRRREPREEHDPEWQVAMVRVTSAIRGTTNGAVVPVVFAASRDILWFNSPKLHAGEAALILGQRPRESEATLLRSTGASTFVRERHAVLVTDPADVLPLADEQRVIGLLQGQEVPR